MYSSPYFTINAQDKLPLAEALPILKPVLILEVF